MGKLYGSVECGGTKFICAVGNENFEVVESCRFDTTTPEETLTKTVKYFKKFEDNLAAVCIASFGPIDQDPESKTYGHITKTPKKGWSFTDILHDVSKHFDIPFNFTFDVAAAGYGEYIARKGITGLVYYTIGTGIGSCYVEDGKLIGRLGHQESGHVFVKLHPYDIERGFKGDCPYHGDCLEGLAAGPSLEARSGIRGENLPLDSPLWDVQAYYIAQAAIQATYFFRPQVIVFGGGVMAQKHMLDRVRSQFSDMLNDYVPIPPIEEYIVTPCFENNGSATHGNFALAKQAEEMQ